MSRDLYSALSGASATMTQMDRLSNNLANVSTSGFRASRTRFELTGPNPELLGQSYAMARDGGISEANGPVAHDGQQTHLALQGQGWFALQTPDGVRLTRDGSFQLNEEGQLVNAQGHQVLGDGGPIEVPVGERISVSAEGVVSGSESGELDRLRLVDAPVRALGGNLFEATAALTPAAPHVEQGALEGSNADPMSTMVELMEAGRYFEAFQKAMQTSDELDGRLLEMARQ